LSLLRDISPLTRRAFFRARDGEEKARRRQEVLRRIAFIEVLPKKGDHDRFVVHFRDGSKETVSQGLVSELLWRDAQQKVTEAAVA
jgi:hypothetical protein